MFNAWLVRYFSNKSKFAFVLMHTRRSCRVIMRWASSNIPHTLFHSQNPSKGLEHYKTTATQCPALMLYPFELYVSLQSSQNLQNITTHTSRAHPFGRRTHIFALNVCVFVCRSYASKPPWNLYTILFFALTENHHPKPRKSTFHQNLPLFPLQWKFAHTPTNTHLFT